MVNGKLAYLLDASAIVHFYQDSPATTQIQALVEKKLANSAILFIPNFCIAEVFNVFARLHFREKKIDERQYKTLKENFASHVRNANLFYHYQLNRYHVLNTDWIVPFEHQHHPTRVDFKTQMSKPWHLSTFDIMILAMGIELVRIMGEQNTFVVTCDTRINVISRILRKLAKEDREKYGIPQHVVYPQISYFNPKQKKESIN